MLIIGFLGLASSGSCPLKNASSTSGMACLIRALLSLSSRQAWKRSSIKLSVMMSLSGRHISRGSAWHIMWLFSSEIFGKSRLKEDLSFSGSHDLSNERSCATSATVSLTVLNSVGAGAEPKGSRPRRYAISSRMVIQVFAACILAWMRLYAASMSVLFMYICVCGCVNRIACMSVMNLVSAWPYMHSSS